MQNISNQLSAASDSVQDPSDAWNKVTFEEVAQARVAHYQGEIAKIQAAIEKAPLWVRELTREKAGEMGIHFYWVEY